MEDGFDFIVIGSGIAGAHAAQTLAEQGVQVAMLDVGKTDTHYRNISPRNDFVSLRRNDEEQHHYLLGEDAESLSWGPTATGPQLTPARKFSIADVQKWMPLESDSFAPLESLAYGGLGNAWGAGSYVYSRNELQQIGLNVSEMETAYQIIADRIGISGGEGDIRSYATGNIRGLQPAIKVEPLIEAIEKRYENQKKYFNDHGFFIGRPPLAALTSPKEDREPLEYREMEFYDDHEKAVYRPWITVDKLKKLSNFIYKANFFVTRFEEQNEGVMVFGINTKDGTPGVFKAKKLLLAGGVLSTARIVLRSFNKLNHQLPLLCNAYTYIPSLAVRHWKTAVPERRTALTQMVLFYDPDKTNSNASLAAMYTYRSLLFIRLLKEVPLPVGFALSFMKNLQPLIILSGIHHPEQYGPDKKIWLKPDASQPTGDKLHAVYKLSDNEKIKNQDREKQIMKAVRKLGCMPLKKVDPGMGSSLHYAGTLPFSEDPKPLHLRQDGLLHFTKRIFVADGSGFRYLPAKGISLSLMANAHRVALHSLKSGNN